MKLCLTCLRCYEDDVLSCSYGIHDSLISPRFGSCCIAGRYRLVKRLGCGGMGAVYEAIHLELNRSCAIKLLAPEYISSDPHARTRLRQEALTECDFDHPNLIRLYDFGTNVVTIEENDRVRDYDELYIVMELLKGQSLKHLLAPRKPLPLDKVITIATQVADGLAEVHFRQVVHRDLKPENILLCSDHKGELVVKIVDFGAVKMLRTSSSADVIDLTKARFVGTVVYASPENCKGESLDERSDIYCLGLIIYEMLAGRRPFEDRGFLPLLNSHAYEAPPPLSGIPKALADLTLAALEKDPARRPQTAKEFATALRNLNLTTIETSEPSYQTRTVDTPMNVENDEETVVARRQDVQESEVAAVAAQPTSKVLSRQNSNPLSQIPEFHKVEIPVVTRFPSNQAISLKQKMAIAVIALTLLSVAIALSTRGTNSESKSAALDASSLPARQPSPVIVVARQEQSTAQEATTRPVATTAQPSPSPGRITVPKITFPAYLSKPVSIPKFTLDLPSPKVKLRDNYSDLFSYKAWQDFLRRNRRLRTTTFSNQRPTRNRADFRSHVTQPAKRNSMNPRPKSRYSPRRR
jgi:serine/threonine protein kinase